MTRTIFSRFGIAHISASSLGKWTGDRGAWVAHYIFGLKGEAGPAAWRGSAVEEGLTAHVTEAAVDPLSHALMTFERDALGDMDDMVEKERALIAPMLSQSIIAWTDAALSRPITQQIRIETWLDGIDVPLIGFADFVMPGYCIDLKTTKALPSIPRYDHILQASAYAHARREEKAVLLYVTGKKRIFHELSAKDIQLGVADLTRRARGLQTTLKAAWSQAQGHPGKARLRLAEMCPPNIDSFYWDPDDLAEARAKIAAWT